MLLLIGDPILGEVKGEDYMLYVHLLIVDIYILRNINKCYKHYKNINPYHSGLSPIFPINSCPNIVPAI